MSVFSQHVASRNYKAALEWYVDSIKECANAIFNDVPDELLLNRSCISDMVIAYLLQKIGGASDAATSRGGEDKYGEGIKALSDELSGNDELETAALARHVADIRFGLQNEKLLHHELSNEYRLVGIMQDLVAMLERRSDDGARDVRMAGERMDIDDDGEAMRLLETSKRLSLEFRKRYEHRDKAYFDDFRAALNRLVSEEADGGDPDTVDSVQKYVQNCEREFEMFSELQGVQAELNESFLAAATKLVRERDDASVHNQLLLEANAGLTSSQTADAGKWREQEYALEELRGRNEALTLRVENLAETSRAASYEHEATVRDLERKLAESRESRRELELSSSETALENRTLKDRNETLSDARRSLQGEVLKFETELGELRREVARKNVAIEDGDRGASDLQRRLVGVQQSRASISEQNDKAIRFLEEKLVEASAVMRRRDSEIARLRSRTRDTALAVRVEPSVAMTAIDGRLSELDIRTSEEFGAWFVQVTSQLRFWVTRFPTMRRFDVIARCMAFMAWLTSRITRVEACDNLDTYFTFLGQLLDEALKLLRNWSIFTLPDLRQINEYISSHGRDMRHFKRLFIVTCEFFFPKDTASSADWVGNLRASLSNLNDWFGGAGTSCDNVESAAKILRAITNNESASNSHHEAIAFLRDSKKSLREVIESRDELQAFHDTTARQFGSDSPHLLHDVYPTFIRKVNALVLAPQDAQTAQIGVIDPAQEPADVARTYDTMADLLSYIAQIVDLKNGAEWKARETDLRAGLSFLAKLVTSGTVDEFVRDYGTWTEIAETAAQHGIAKESVKSIVQNFEYLRNEIGDVLRDLQLSVNRGAEVDGVDAARDAAGLDEHMASGLKDKIVALKTALARKDRNELFHRELQFWSEKLSLHAIGEGPYSESTDYGDLLWRTVERYCRDRENLPPETIAELIAGLEAVLENNDRSAITASLETMRSRLRGPPSSQAASPMVPSKTKASKINKRKRTEEHSRYDATTSATKSGEKKRAKHSASKKGPSKRAIGDGGNRDGEDGQSEQLKKVKVVSSHESLLESLGEVAPPEEVEYEVASNLGGDYPMTADRSIAESPARLEREPRERSAIGPEHEPREQLEQEPEAGPALRLEQEPEAGSPLRLEQEPEGRSARPEQAPEEGGWDSYSETEEGSNYESLGSREQSDEDL